MSTTERPEDYGGILRRTPGSVRVRQGDGGGRVVEANLEMATGDDVIASPVANVVKGAREDINEDEHDTVFDLYDALIELDGELSGAVNAIAQSATFRKVVMPEDDPSEIEQEILGECQDLVDRIRGREMAIDVLRNLIKYGNDISKKVYNKEEGILAAQSLPINAMTIVDDPEDLADSNVSNPSTISELFQQIHPDLASGDEEIGGERIQEAFKREAYVLNEGKDEETTPKVIEPYKVLHFSIDSRSNWFTDHTGRVTYGVWGQSRLEALKFTIQTKYNTLTNKVAMDDKLLAREVYYINTDALFGHIQDQEEREKKADEYADELAGMLEELEADERPLLDENVEVEVIGPEGKAIDQRPFVEQLNNGIAAALTFPMAGLGRGTTAVKAGEEISSLWAENNIKNLRRAVIRGFTELFEDHVKLTHPDLVQNLDGADNLGEMKLDPEVTIPTLEYEPFRQEDRTQLANQIRDLYELGVMSLAEARDEWGLPTDGKSLDEARKDFNNYTLGRWGHSTAAGSDGQSNGQQPPDNQQPNNSNQQETPNAQQ